MADYKGTVELISGITPKNGGSFPLVNAKDVLMPDGTRLSEFTGGNGSGGTSGSDGEDGVSITKAEINSDGELVLTFSDGNTTNVGKVVGEDGVDGEDGSDGITPHIGGNGNWWIGSSDTGVKAEGKDGADGSNGSNGVDGKDGSDGVTPHIGDNGNWWLGSSDTGVKAEGKDGIDGNNGSNGVDGEDGYTPVKGVDYFTEADISAIVEQVIDTLPNAEEVSV